MIWGNKIRTIISPKLSTKYQIIRLAWALIPLFLRCVTDPTEKDIYSVQLDRAICPKVWLHTSNQRRLVWIISNKLYSSQAGHLPKSDRFHHTTILKVRYGRPNFSLSIGDRFSDAGTKFCLSSLTLSYIWVILSLCSSARTHTCTRTLTSKVIFCKTAGIPLESSLSLCCCTRIHTHTHVRVCANTCTHAQALSLCAVLTEIPVSPAF